MKSRSLTALLCALMFASSPSFADPPPGINSPVTPVVVKLGADGAVVGDAAPFPVTCISGCPASGVTGPGTAADALRVELPTDGTGKVGLNAGTAIIGEVGIDQTTPGTTNGVVVNSSALPTGAATAANQTTANASLSSVDTKLTTINTTLGSPLQAGGSLATVTAVTGITNPVAVTGTFWQATQPVSGTVTANLGTLGGAALDTSVDGVEALIGTTNTTLTTIDGRVDGLETNTTDLLKAPATYVAGTVKTPYSTPISITLTTIDLAATYAITQNIGGLQTIDVGTAAGVSMANKKVRIISLIAGVQAATTTTNGPTAAAIFEGNPSATTFADAVATTLNVADLPKWKWTGAASSATGGAGVWANGVFYNYATIQLGNQGVIVTCDASGYIYLAIQAGGTVTNTTGKMSITIVLGIDS